jgi:hypothetical protein
VNLPRTNGGGFLILFFALAVAGLALLIWRETEIVGGWRDAVLRVVQNMEAVVVIGAIVAYAAIEGASMIAEQFKKQRFKEGKQKGREEGFEEALKTLESIQAQFPNGPDLAAELRRGLEVKRQSGRQR